MEPTRIQLRLAEGLGLSQAVRQVADALAAGAGDRKAAGRARDIAAGAAVWQERLNERVVAEPATRDRLTTHARGVRDRAIRAALADEDPLTLAEQLAALTHREAAHWAVLRRLAKAVDDRATLALAREARPIAGARAASALKACRRLAKREARAAAG